MTIPEDIKKVVAFVLVQNENGEYIVPWGTAFFVGVKSPKNDNSVFLYLITAKHVLKTEDRKSWLSNICIRLNTIDGGYHKYILPINPAGDQKSVYLHPDNTVDLAVIPIKFESKMLDIVVLPENMITSKEEFINLDIKEGSEIFFTGLFSYYIGTSKNYPIVRFGRVSLITAEKINFIDNAPTTLYLIETGSYGGNSGSPVYFYLGMDRKPGSIIMGPPLIKLAGIMSGTFYDIKKVIAVETAKIPIAQSNMGIAAVVPAYQLYELLFGDELNKIRTRNK